MRHLVTWHLLLTRARRAFCWRGLLWSFIAFIRHATMLFGFLCLLLFLVRLSHGLTFARLDFSFGLFLFRKGTSRYSRGLLSKRLASFLQNSVMTTHRLERFVSPQLEKSTRRVKVTNSLNNCLRNDTFRVALAIVVSSLYFILHQNERKTC